jgi:hypothetical protein
MVEGAIIMQQGEGRLVGQPGQLGLSVGLMEYSKSETGRKYQSQGQLSPGQSRPLPLPERRVKSHRPSGIDFGNFV